MTKSDKLLCRLTIFAVIILGLAFWSIAQAAPFLVCDPQENVTSYIVTMNGVTEESLAQDMGNNTTRLHYDLEGITSGAYDCNVTAKNMWGASAPVPFSFKKILPGCPSVLDISVQ